MTKILYMFEKLIKYDLKFIFKIIYTFLANFATSHSDKVS